jgi:hypothetical protein
MFRKLPSTYELAAGAAVSFNKQAGGQLDAGASSTKSAK